MIMDSSIALALILEPIIIISSFSFGIYKLIMFIKKKNQRKNLMFMIVSFSISAFFLLSLLHLITGVSHWIIQKFISNYDLGFD